MVEMYKWLVNYHPIGRGSAYSKPSYLDIDWKEWSHTSHEQYWPWKDYHYQLTIHYCCPCQMFSHKFTNIY